MSIRNILRLQHSAIRKTFSRTCTTVTNGKATSELTQNEEREDVSFKELLDQSPLMKFGRADNKCVVGKITDVCNDDLYVDFGAKFEAVVKRPSNSKSEEYKIGTLVRLILKKFEMTGQFLGDEQHITLNEADAILIGRFKEVSK